jgi:ATP-dependent RNA helicase DHX57
LITNTQTSITIDDVAVVIDSGKAKITEYDSATGLVNLKEKWITVSAANQRRGRAGRSQAGQCYRLYTEHMMASFVPFLEPEILRMPLENVVLQCKAIRRNEDTKVRIPQVLVSGPTKMSIRVI